MDEPGGVRTGMVSTQIALAKQMLAALDPAQAQRYAALHHGFIAAAQAGMMVPDQRPQKWRRSWSKH